MQTEPDRRAPTASPTAVSSPLATFADINVIDFDALSIPGPEVVHDLPAGGDRLVQRAKGYGCAGQTRPE